MQREPNTEYILSLSYGKDSIACLQAIKELGYPLDRIIHAEVWATDTIPADLPPMVEFKAYADKLIKEKYGIEVEHICAVRGGKKLTYREEKTKSMVSLTRSEYGVTVGSKSMPCQELEKVTYEKLFYHIPNRRKKTTGEKDGWQRHGAGCGANSQLKIAAMRTINSRILISIGTQTEGFQIAPLHEAQRKNIVQYLGIASDEPERIKRHSVSGKILPLVDIGWDEAYCRKWCEENNLLSPIYTTATRGGCWFCHNQGVDQLRLLREDYPDLWALLLKWDLDSPTTFKSDGHTVHDYDKRFLLEELELIPKDKRFRWKMLDMYEVNGKSVKQIE